MQRVISALTAQLAQLVPSARRVHQAAPRALQVQPALLVQLGPLVLAQAAQQALQAFKGLPGSQVHLAQQALKERRALPAPPALTEPQEPRGLPASLAPRAFKALQELAQQEFKDQPERLACPVPPELQGQVPLVPRALQEPG